jgi:DNA-binding PadR family transcriptional regulator
MTNRKLAVVAVGGNSLVKDERRKSLRHQYMVVKETSRHIADMIEAGWDMAIGHGNGPQLGFSLRRSEIAFRSDNVPPFPMDICIAENQAEVGYALQQNLQNELFKRGIQKQVATIIAQTLVDEDDPAYRLPPTKPTGSFMTEEEAKHLASQWGWTVAVSTPVVRVVETADVDQIVVAADAIENIPSEATPALSVIVQNTKEMLGNFPQKIPTAFSSVLSGGGRTGGDLVRVFQRYWLILYLIGHWRLAASMELEEALAETVGVSAGSGSMHRVLEDMEKANVLTIEILDLKSPRTVLKLYRLSPEGEKLYQALFQTRAYENDWSRLIRLHEGARFPEHTLAVLAFTMHARKRGWATQVLPEVKKTKSVPDAWIMRGDEKLYIEVELGEKERVSKWRNQAVLNGGYTALCAATQKSRARLVGDCKLDHLPGLATDLESLVRGKFREINSTSPLWLASWK